MSIQHGSIRWRALLTVLITGMAMGFFVWKTYFASVPPLYPPEFTQAEWLVTTSGEPQAYFRKELYIPGSVQQAWLTVAASDAFVIYLNGKVVDAKEYAAMTVSGVYDIGPTLHPGKNVLGMVARRNSYPGPAMAVLEGGYRDQAGRLHVLATDASWKVSPTFQSQGNGEIPWYAESFDATAWMASKTAGRPTPSEVYPLDVHPWVFTMPPQGKWIGATTARQEPITFSSAFTLAAPAEDAWLRLVAAAPYALAVNGVAVTGRETPDDMQAGQSAPRPREVASTHVYRIAPFLRSGVNHISVSARSGVFSPTGLFVDGFAISRGERLVFGTDTTWTVTAEPTATHDDHRRSAAVLTAQEFSGGLLPRKQAMSPVLPCSYTLTQVGQAWLVMLLTTGLFVALWLGTSHLLELLQQGDVTVARSLGACVYLPTLLLLGSVFLLSFDVRMDPTLPFQKHVIWLACGVFVGLKTLLLFEACYRPPRPQLIPRTTPGRLPLATPQVYRLFLLVLLIVGAYLRLHQLDGQSLYHDEIHMVTYVRGLLAKGYPYKMVGSIERPLATYELVPYPIALSMQVFGANDFALRLPAALFGITTILLLYVIGKEVFDARVGLLAAAMFTFCPQALIWAKYLWHPQQTQFFALLTSYLFYRAIRSTPISPHWLYLATFTYLLTYLSWEGTGFLLPALGVGLLVVKGREVSWLRDKHLWIACGVVGAGVGGQLVRRILLQAPYMVVGEGLSNVSLPSFYFLEPTYDPTVYLKNFLWLENNAVLTLLLLGGLVFCRKHKALAYYTTLVLVILALMTNLLSHAAIRYVYYLQTFLILSAAAVVWCLLDGNAGVIQARRFRILRWLQGMVTIAVCGLVVLGSSGFLRLYRLTHFANPLGLHIKTNVYYADYRSSAHYLKAHYQSGDLVIAVVSEPLRYYADITSDYFVESDTKRQVLYDPGQTSPRYLERTVGTPVLRNLEELRSLFNRHRRIWIVAVPYQSFGFLAGPDVNNYIHQRAKVVYESYNARVFLLQS
jgi:4-amino-4-deoxy-L-arabinose transferase-like glycosyltransferase